MNVFELKKTRKFFSRIGFIVVEIGFGDNLDQVLTNLSKKCKERDMTQDEDKVEKIANIIGNVIFWGIVALGVAIVVTAFGAAFTL